MFQINIYLFRKVFNNYKYITMIRSVELPIFKNILRLVSRLNAFNTYQ